MNQKDLGLSRLLDLYGPLLTERQRSVMECYYFEDLSLGEIADNNGTTRQCVHMIIRRATAQLQRYEAELSLARLSDNMARIAALADSLPEGLREQILKLTEL